MNRSYYSPQDDLIKVLQSRIRWLGIFIFLLLGFLLFRAWYLQVINGDNYKELSKNNRVRIVTIRPPRGLIYDRNGTLLINNLPSFNLYLVLNDIPDIAKVIDRLDKMIGIDKEEVLEKVNSGLNRPLIPILIKGGLTMKEVAFIEAHRIDLPGILTKAELQRNFIYGKLGAHVFGYVGEISPSQIEEKEFEGVTAGRIVGQSGIERKYDSILRGMPGKKSIEVDALGHEIKVLDIDAPTPGDNIYLTIDLQLQKVAEDALGDDSGVIVAMDPNNGDILAFVSHPSFDPNLLSKGMNKTEWQKMINDPSHPFTNRIIQGQYPPGSIFKIVVATAVLESAEMDPASMTDCRGYLKFGRRIFNDWKRGGHGSIDLHRAIVESCDVYFYKAGNMLGIDKLADFAFRYGLGHKTGIDILSEKSGIIPTRKWKKRTIGEPWFPGETLSVAIGQGYVTVTPIQMLSMISTVATGGKRYQPRLFNGIIKEPTKEVFEFPPIKLNDLDISKETFKIIQDALRDVVSDRHGTARAARSKITEIAGKTGTAQVVGANIDMKKEEIPDKFKDHAWFVSYAPANDPQIAVVAIVEHGGHGGSKAAPLAKRVIEVYMKGKV
ncbi:MAG: penicillin-binding protein 2 [Nitrospirota bacterium]